MIFIFLIKSISPLVILKGNKSLQLKIWLDKIPIGNFLVDSKIIVPSICVKTQKIYFENHSENNSSTTKSHRQLLYNI